MTRTPIRQFRTQLMVGLAAVIMLIWGAVADHLGMERDAALKHAALQGRNLSAVVASHFSSYAGTIDRLLKRLRVQWGQDPLHFARAVEREQKIRGDTFTFLVSVVDAQGSVVYSDAVPGKDRPFPGGRNYFVVQRAGATDELGISGESQDSASGALTIRFTRPLFDEKGKFSGLLMVSVPSEAIARSYETLELGSNGVVGIRRLDNTLVLRWPGIAFVGQKLPEIPLDAAGKGSDIRRGRLDGVERVFSFQRIPGYPLVAVVGQALDTVLAEPRHERWFYLAAGGMGSLAVLVLGAVLLSKLKREERVENALAMSESRFRSLTELASDVYWEQDDQYRFTSFSGSSDQSMLKGDGAAVGKRRWDSHYLNMSQADWAVHIALLEARKPFRDLELCRFDDAGRKVWISVSGEPVFDASGVFTGYRGIGKEITERKRAEQMQALEHKVNRCLAEGSSVSATLKDTIRAVCETEGWECGRYLRVDEQAAVLRFYESWTLPVPEIERYIEDSRRMVYGPGVGLVGQVWQSGTPLWVADITQDPRIVRKALARDADMRGAFVVPVKAEAKTIAVMIFQSRDIREPDERLLQAISVIGSQIGQFVQRRLAEEVRRESEERFRSLTELSSDLYWEQDDQYRFTTFSGSGSAWMGMGPSTMEGKRRWDFRFLNMTEADWTAHVATLDVRKPFRDLELCRLDDSGRKVWVSVSGEPVFDASGAFKGYRGIGKDITERKRAEQLRLLEHAVSRSLAEADSVTAAVQAVIRAVCETEEWACGRFFRWDDKAGVLQFVDGWGTENEDVRGFLAKSRGLSYAPGIGLTGRVWQSRQPIWVSDVTYDARVAQTGLASDHGMRGAFVFPVIADGSVTGVLAFTSREARQPEERLMQAISVIGAQIGQFLGRKQREEELRRFRAGMDVSEDMIWLLDPANVKIIDVNDTACRKLGYRREELVGMGAQDIIAMSREELSAIYSRLIAGGAGDTIESWYRRKDGSQFPVEVSRRALESEGGHVIVAVVRDVTERRAAEEELRRFRLAMDNSADMVVLIDRATMRFVDVNETACRLLGFSREELLQKGPQDVLPVTREALERDYDQLIAHYTGCAGAVVGGMKSHYVCKDGSLLPFESTRHVMRSADTYIIAAVSRDIRERLAAEEKVAYLAQFDTLTGLPNRHLFQDRLTQAMALAKRNDWPMAVLFIDLDRFKLVNDTLGHGAGDKLLKEAAERLRTCIRASDTVGRLGGDEFAAILSELRKPADAGLVAQKIIDVFKRPFNLEGRETYVTASVGITLYPADSDNAEALIMNADTAMYRAKEQGRNNYQYFTRDMNQRALQRVRMEAALRRALERNEFRVFYQPKVHLRAGKICGFEALLRWQHPEKGMILPGDFIPVLEETGLIIQTGEWVLRTVCAQIKAWEGSGLRVPPISVNLSARQFEQRNLVGLVREVLQAAEVDPSRIELEITESLLMHDPEGATRTLHALKESGVRLSMDDFGTGYSSLGYLKRFPIDTLKIDRTFVRDLSTDADDATLTRAIIHLARNLRLRVVAEGVETEAQLAFLRENGCDEMQGYLFAKPTDAEECQRMLREKRALALPRADRWNAGLQPRRRPARRAA